MVFFAKLAGLARVAVIRPARIPPLSCHDQHGVAGAKRADRHGVEGKGQHPADACHQLAGQAA